jgi:hypothetical protein
LLKALGLGEWVRSAAKASDPQQTVINAVRENTFTPSPPEVVGAGNVLGLLTSVDRSFESLLIFGRYLNELVAEARAGDMESLFKAVQIDPSAVASPSIAARIGRAVALKDEAFLKDLRTALAGRTRNFAAYLRQLRYAIQAVREAGVDDLSPRELEELFIKKVEAWDGSASANPRKAVDKHWKASARKSTT